MKLFLDCSDVHLIQHVHETGLIDGVTTNPSLMKKIGQDPVEVIKRISDMFPWSASISAEVVGETADEMLDMAEIYTEINPNITIKLPLTREGLIACKELSTDSIPTNVTLIFSAAQAILAAKAGATYVSPFVGRVFDQHWDGIELIREIADIYLMNEIPTQVLAASIRDPRSVSQAIKAGADVVTMPYDVFMKMYNHILTDKGLEIFDKDWKELQNEL